MKANKHIRVETITAKVKTKKTYWLITYYVFLIAMVALFAFASADKLSHLKDFRESIKNTWLLAWLPAGLVAWAVPLMLGLMALALVGGVLNPTAQHYALRAYLVLITMFTLFCGIILAAPDRLPCQCLGLNDNWSWWTQLGVNFVVMLWVWLTIWLHDKWILVTGNEHSENPW